MLRKDVELNSVQAADTSKLQKIHVTLEEIKSLLYTYIIILYTYFVLPIH